MWLTRSHAFVTSVLSVTVWVLSLHLVDVAQELKSLSEARGEWRSGYDLRLVCSRLVSTLPLQPHIHHVLIPKGEQEVKSSWNNSVWKIFSSPLRQLWLVITCPPGGGLQGLGIASISCFQGSQAAVDFWVGNLCGEHKALFLNQNTSP